MIYYLDASCLLRRLLGDGPLIADWGDWDAAFTSDVGLVEVHRTLDRVTRERRLSRSQLAAANADFDELRAGVRWIELRSEIVALACGPLPVPMKALDAIHLATARLVRDRAAPALVFATHDRRLAGAASEFGFEVAGI